MVKSNGDTGRVLALLILASVILIFTVFNYQAFDLSIDINEVIGYALMVLVTYAVYSNWDDFKGWLEGPRSLIGIDADMKEDIAWAVLAGGVFIGMNTVSAGFSLGIPVYRQALADTILLVVVVAPVLEELFFRGAIYQFVKGYFGDDKKAVIYAVAIIAILFSGFHFLFYGMDLQAGYVGTATMSTIAIAMMEKRKSLLPPIIFHAIINLYILLTTVITI